VAKLLSFSRLAATARIVPNVDVGAVVHAAEVGLAEHLRSAGASVVVGVMPTIDADPALLRELFCHLFDNALKFRREGVPPTIHVASTPRSDGRVDITVADNGIGLDEADAEHIFEVFRRLHPPDRYSGAGIGLATCRRIAELHGGEIRVRGAVGEGSVFTVSLPIRAHLGEPTECLSTVAP
jgi:signal transduction histidine kinase